jgi:hypothetical protein
MRPVASVVTIPSTMTKFSAMIRKPAVYSVTPARTIKDDGYISLRIVYVTPAFVSADAYVFTPSKSNAASLDTISINGIKLGGTVRLPSVRIVAIPTRGQESSQDRLCRPNQLHQPRIQRHHIHSWHPLSKNLLLRHLP